jgi:hypothetical protein
MLPRNLPNAPRPVRRFEVITPAGRVYQFPRPSLLLRLAKLFYAHADVVAVSATILVLIYVAALAGEALERSAFDACNERMKRLTGIS